MVTICSIQTLTSYLPTKEDPLVNCLEVPIHINKINTCIQGFGQDTA